MSYKCLLVVAGIHIHMGSAWASISACVAPPGTAMSTLGTGSNASGCAQTDMNFVNLNLGTETGFNTNGTLNNPTTANIDLGAAGGTISGNPSTIGEIDATWTSPNATAIPSGNGWYVKNAGHTTTTGSGSVSFEATANNGATNSSPVNPPGDTWIISALDLVITTAASGAYGTSGTTSSASIVEQFCLNATSLGGCAAAAKGSITAAIGASNAAPSFTWILGSNSGSGNTINLLANFAGQVTSVFVNNTISVTDGSAGNNRQVAFINDFSNGFDQAEDSPEPSTFVLLGAALAVIGLLRFSARRRNSIGATE